MKQYTWDEYYDKFFDWAQSTQTKNLYGLTSLGPADEVAEVIYELQCDEKSVNRLLKKAVEEKLVFSGDNMRDLMYICDLELFQAALINSASQLTAEDVEEFVDYVDDEVIINICQNNQIQLPESLQDDDVFIEDIPYRKPKKPGLLALLLGIASMSGPDNRHNGKCNGNCSQCPPHYGYRYGRWYFGHDHAYGCEFGGNKCSGSM